MVSFLVPPPAQLLSEQQVPAAGCGPCLRYGSRVQLPGGHLGGSQGLRGVVLKLERTPDFPGGFVKTDLWAPTPPGFLILKVWDRV